MTDILNKINQSKFEEVAFAKKHISLNDIKAKAQDAEKPRDFLAALHAKHAHNQAAVIAEIKKASPSKGLIRADFNPHELANAYQAGGAACLSVLTDEQYFSGSLKYLQEAKAACDLPILRKDFVVDEYQIYQARANGADAVLLIAASLSDNQLQEFETIAHALNMTALIELHNEHEWQKCERLTSPLFGVNNRNLRTFAVDTNQTVRLLPLLKNKTVVCESGIQTHSDILKMQENGVHTFLVGESLMRQENVTLALQQLLGVQAA
ncbi:MAG: indole-3-glycerol phosphate synthase TrpC [Neisseriaceae bacterium]|nr:indole-3-glycerol phosphate synthase TrpC [Neisseriaceae bacterium]